MSTCHNAGPAGDPKSAYHNPAANAQATCSFAAVSGRRNVCTALAFGIVTQGSAPTAADLVFNLRDGATGAGTILASWTYRVPASANANLIHVTMDNLWIKGSANTAMTLETSGATGANVRAYVNLIGAVV